MPTSRFSRRRLLQTAAALPIAAAVPALASAPMLGVSNVTFSRFMLGDFEVTTLLAATLMLDEPHKIFGTNVSDEEFAEASRQANIPVDKVKFFFTPTLVNTGKELVLFDTGLDAKGITSALASAGYTPEQVDVVVITHMHPDHIGGLINANAPTFANARYVTGNVEFDSWAKLSDGTFEAKMRPLAEQTSMINSKGSVLPGITPFDAPGHTPGHMAYMLESNGQQLLLGADFANHYIWSLAHPTWEVRFDMDKELAAITRGKMLDMLATDKIPFIGYHMPWPALGYVESRGDGFTYVPESYQMHM
jgi:glyoxylase-like metal-dependent hydrolase (beta-lactamase superfamily II)